MAATAWAMWMINDEPPTAVVSVYVGFMPRYSPRFYGGCACGHQTVHIAHGQPGVFEGVVCGFSVKLKVGLFHSSNLVGFCHSNNGNRLAQIGHLYDTSSHFSASRCSERLMCVCTKAKGICRRLGYTVRGFKASYRVVWCVGWSVRQSVSTGMNWMADWCCIATLSYRRQALPCR